MNKDDIVSLNELAEIIRKHGAISKGMLYRNSKIGIWKFKELVKFLPEVYDDIRYNRKKLSYNTTHSLSLFTQESMK